MRRFLLVSSNTTSSCSKPIARRAPTCRLIRDRVLADPSNRSMTTDEVQGAACATAHHADDRTFCERRVIAARAAVGRFRRPRWFARL